MNSKKNNNNSKEPFFKSKIYTINISGSIDVEVSDDDKKTVTMIEDKGEGVENQKNEQ
jgi:hypothetical protein